MDHKKKSPYRLLFSLSEYAEFSSSNVEIGRAHV